MALGSCVLCRVSRRKRRRNLLVLLKQMSHIGCAVHVSTGTLLAWMCGRVRVRVREHRRRQAQFGQHEAMPTGIAIQCNMIPKEVPKLWILHTRAVPVQ